MAVPPSRLEPEDISLEYPVTESLIPTENPGNRDIWPPLQPTVHAGWSTGLPQRPNTPLPSGKTGPAGPENLEEEDAKKSERKWIVGWLRKAYGLDPIPDNHKPKKKYPRAENLEAFLPGFYIRDPRRSRKYNDRIHRCLQRRRRDFVEREKIKRVRRRHPTGLMPNDLKNRVLRYLPVALLMMAIIGGFIAVGVYLSPSPR
ncbi:hypothetical protein ACRE_006290 [Hapsidospora chrysogenum ATCC 11550]|uniref:Uncharacterized protein n=1 Tax=Hapsidospora chrysogenum (strain ATCC 11550 / CBS 779.69 / DSM 880 / IAM 14645 / JCM 23072 / IMI 49137) TaxID=857340 RepID=A0A086TGP7_HAPC1|nr:hypothetical protein ACRE_006290 [Hapsidospora chrysogenum ATCC 11550]